jgi:hypothetical protein
MLSNNVVEEIRRLLAEGKLSQRQISKHLDVSRGTVSSVALNRRHEPESPEDDPDLGPPARCPSCGVLVFMPCVLCRARLAQFGPRGERSLLSADMRPATFGDPNERRRRKPQPSEPNRSPREASSPRPERNARLPGR